MSWEQIWGHEAEVEVLQHALMHARLSRSLLLSGPEGVGKTLMATSIAAALLDTAHPEHHTEYQLLEPKSSTTVIPVAAVREALRRLHHTPVQGTAQVAIIIGAERLNAEGANTLLQTLEEPPKHAYLILTTRDAGQCVPTIVSRCQQVRLRPWSRELLAKRLVSDCQVDSATAQHIALHVGGCVGMARRFLREKQPATVEQLFQALHSDQGWAGEKRARLQQLLEQYTWWCRDQLCRHAGYDDHPLRSSSIAPGAQPVNVQDALRLLEDALAHEVSLRQHVNPKLLLWALQQEWATVAA